MRVFFSTDPRQIYVAKAKFTGPKRKVTRTYSRLSGLSKAMGNAVRVDLVRGITRFKNRISLKAVSEAWEKGEYGKLMTTIPWDSLHGDVDPAIKKIGNTVRDSGLIQLSKLPPNVNRNLRFDVTNPRIKNFITSRTGELVKNIQEDAQKSIQAAVARSFSEAKTPREVAVEIKNSIGLLPKQELAVRNFARGLQEKGGYTDANILDHSAKYVDRLLDQRAMVIARTETRMATNEGQIAIWQEGVNQGLLDKNTTQKEWVVDGAPCEVCEPMDGVRVGLYDPWILEYPNGEIKAVYNPTEAHPNCYCGMELHFTESEKEE